MIYQDNDTEGLIFLLHHIDGFARAKNITLHIDTEILLHICYTIRTQLPCINGVDKASVFKKVSFFVSTFIEKEPIKTKSSGEILGNDLANMDINAVIAFDIAISLLKGAKIHREDGECVISENIFLSNHSYIDIIDALSTKGNGRVSAASHFKLLSVFFEQLVYKTNPSIQYCEISKKPILYNGNPHSCSDGDDIMGN